MAKTMKTLGGGLHYLDGPQGHGKTFMVVRWGTDGIVRGNYFVSNVELLAGWAKQLARHDLAGYLYRSFSLRERARYFESLYVHTDEIRDVFRFDLPCLKCGAPPSKEELGYCRNGHRLTEARGRAAWDEAHNDVGNRTWQEDGRPLLLKGASQLRKMGYEFRLVTQHEKNTDAGLRRVAGYRIRMTNQKERFRKFGMKIVPVTLFIASFYRVNDGLEPAAASAQAPDFYSRFLLSHHKRLYNTLAIHSGLFEELEALGARVTLPPAGEALTRRRRGGAVPASELTGRWWLDLSESTP